MTRGNFTPFKAKHVESIKFGGTAWTNANMTSTTIALDTSFATNNTSILADLAAGSSVDAVNPTKTACWAKDFSESGNERATSEENFLGADSTGSQCQELSSDTISKITVEFTLVYRNTVPSTLFSDSTKACLIEMDNAESSTTGQLNIGYNNIIVTHAGSLVRNSDGFMEQKVKFECRGGMAGTAITVTQTSPTESWSRIRLGMDKAEEIRTA
jgi:hypothetical protein